MNDLHGYFVITASDSDNKKHSYLVVFYDRHRTHLSRKHTIPLSGRLNSHRHTRHDKTVLSVSCLAWRCELVHGPFTGHRCHCGSRVHACMTPHTVSVNHCHRNRQQQQQQQSSDCSGISNADATATKPCRRQFYITATCRRRTDEVAFLINVTAYRPLSAFKTQEFINIRKRDTPFVCVYFRSGASTPYKRWSKCTMKK